MEVILLNITWVYFSIWADINLTQLQIVFSDTIRNNASELSVHTMCLFAQRRTSLHASKTQKEGHLRVEEEVFSQ